MRAALLLPNRRLSGVSVLGNCIEGMLRYMPDAAIRGGCRCGGARRIAECTHPIEYGRTVTNFPPMSPSTRIYIAGHQGLVGSALWRHFTARGFENLIGLGSSELDLRDAGATAAFFRATRPQVVIDAAARVGGIAANALRPADFVSDNLRIQLNLLDTAVASGGVERFLFLGSSCIYPKFAAQPIREEALLTGPLEESNEGYAVAKLAGIAQVTAIRRQHGLPYVSAMPTNLYGPATTSVRTTATSCPR